MLFTSKEFIILFFLTFAIYYIPLFKQFQIWVLILSSLIFYAYNYPVLLILLVSSIAINTFISYVLVHRDNVHKKTIATLGVVINLATIIFFKYSGLFAKSLELEGTSLGEFLIALPLPLGISFFTFEGISLLIDTYKEEKTENYRSIIAKSFISHTSNTLLFVSFFPHLIAGPILKAHEFYPQIGNKSYQAINWDKAFRQLLIGYFLKVVVADNLKDQTSTMGLPYLLYTSNEMLLWMLYGYSIQIFADFAGYSLIALGLATLLGYELKGNFDFPYISTSFSEFWRRWHISLSSFLREYLYIPLGGNKKGKVRTYINLLLTMFLGGLWHGAAWSYAVWGLAHGLLLALERLFNDFFSVKTVGLFAKILKGFFVFTSVTFAWLLFKLPEFSQVLQYLRAIFENTDFPRNTTQIYLIIIYSLPVVLYHLIHLSRTWPVWNKLEWVAYAIMIFLLVTNSGQSAEFIYFQF